MPHTYARHHGMELHEVTFDVPHDRMFAEDCAECGDEATARERIDEAISLSGKLTDRDRDSLHAVSHECPINKILVDGTSVDSYPNDDQWIDGDRVTS